jgi:hypothetical protein
VGLHRKEIVSGVTDDKDKDKDKDEWTRTRTSGQGQGRVDKDKDEWTRTRTSGQGQGRVDKDKDKDNVMESSPASFASERQVHPDLNDNTEVIEPSRAE